MQSAQSMRSGARSIFNDVSRKAARAAAFSTEIEDAHTTACSNKQNTYKDPATGYTVFTEYAHIKRGTCCGNICRHCPYAHHAVENPEWRNKNQFKNITKPTLLRSKRPDIDSSGGSSKRKYTTDLSRPVDVLFYSGGKNSFLSLMQLQEEERAARPTDTFLSEVILATTYNHWDGTLPHQGVHLELCMAHARVLGLDLLVVPLGTPADETETTGTGEGEGEGADTRDTDTDKGHVEEAQDKAVAVTNDDYTSAVKRGLDVIAEEIHKASSRQRRSDERKKGDVRAKANLKPGRREKDQESQEIESSSRRELRVSFGETFLEACRDWRVDVFSGMGTNVRLHWPLWGMNASEMATRLSSIQKGTLEEGLSVRAEVVQWGIIDPFIEVEGIEAVGESTKSTKSTESGTVKALKTKTNEFNEEFVSALQRRWGGDVSRSVSGEFGEYNTQVVFEFEKSEELEC